MPSTSLTKKGEPLDHACEAVFGEDAPACAAADELDEACEAGQQGDED